VVLLFDVVDGVSVAFQITQRYQEKKANLRRDVLFRHDNAPVH
jgi:hypothetical protein